MLHLKLIRIIGSGDNDLLFIAYSMKPSLGVVVAKCHGKLGCQWFEQNKKAIIIFLTVEPITPI